MLFLYAVENTRPPAKLATPSSLALTPSSIPVLLPPPESEPSPNPIVWGVHVRHGDAKSMADIYGNRRWFPFSDYFDAAAALAVQTASPPTAIYITSDSLETQEEVTLRERGGGPGAAPPPCFPYHSPDTITLFKMMVCIQPQAMCALSTYVHTYMPHRWTRYAWHVERMT